MKKLFKKIGQFNMMLILTLVYFLILPFFKIFFIIFNPSLKKKDGSTWTNIEPVYDNCHEHQF